ncbi:hypothetical protein, partial [Clostridium diolis]|uniref:hypothetical protein n=1 Tax=Clostridium diolis TaxID=223919 RepID=UPI0015E74DCB
PTEDHNNTQGRPEVSGYVGGIQPFVNTFITDSSSELNVWHRPVKDAGGNITREGSQHEVLSALVEDHWAYLSSRRL